MRGKYIPRVYVVTEAIESRAIAVKDRRHRPAGNEIADVGKNTQIGAVGDVVPVHESGSVYQAAEIIEQLELFQRTRFVGGVEPELRLDIRPALGDEDVLDRAQGSLPRGLVVGAEVAIFIARRPVEILREVTTQTLKVFLDEFRNTFANTVRFSALISCKQNL
jgi:hypothetical protein